MSIKEMKVNRWSGDIWHKATRYLNSNLGKPWRDLHSHLCSVADIRTKLGQDIRYFIDREVDDKGKYIASHRDFYVDEHGMLQAYPKPSSYHTHLKERRLTAPIEQIYFKDDGSAVWYEVLTVPERKVSKYTKQQRLWYRTERLLEKYTIPLRDEESQARAVGLKKGKKDFYREVTHETFQRTSIGGKLLAKIKKIVARQTVSGHKFLKLGYVYNSTTEHGMVIAHVSGKSL